MRVRETAEQRHAFEDGVKKWMGVEDKVIAYCDSLTSSTDNVLVRAIADATKADALQHKEMLAAIEQTLTGTITLTPDDLAAISKLLDFVVDSEKPEIEMAAHEKASGSHIIVTELLSFMLEDEKKYDRFRDEFNELKKKIYPYGIS
jgi:hypothetical protein